jgi:hypothetical protein
VVRGVHFYGISIEHTTYLFMMTFRVGQFMALLIVLRTFHHYALSYAYIFKNYPCGVMPACRRPYHDPHYCWKSLSETALKIITLVPCKFPLFRNKNLSRKFYFFCSKCTSAVNVLTVSKNSIFWNVTPCSLSAFWANIVSPHSESRNKTSQQAENRKRPK